MVVPPTPSPQSDGSKDANDREWSEANVFILLLLGVFVMLATQVLLARRNGSPIQVERDPARRFDLQIDLNVATKVELLHLPGIGPSLADRILEDREANGPFNSPEDLKRVAGIGDKTLQRLVPYLSFKTVGSGESSH
ncbi:MAG: helix-hairpin-helix domain-containing protein [Planctomycetota bacterium]